MYKDATCAAPNVGISGERRRGDEEGMRKRSKFDVGWQDWALALALAGLVLLLIGLAVVAWGGWSHQRDVARAMEAPPREAPLTPRR